MTRCPRVLIGEVLDRLPLGDHIGVLRAPAQAHAGTGGDLLMFSDVPAIDPGYPAEAGPTTRWFPMIRAGRQAGWQVEVELAVSRFESTR